MLQSLYKCQRISCTKIRKTSLFLQSLSISCNSNIQTNESKSSVNLCQRKSHGLPKETLISEAKVLELDTDKCSEVSALVEFFQNHGFSATQLKKIISLRPCILKSRVKTLKPKLNFLQSIGLSEDECSKIICTNPNILFVSVSRQLAPSVDSLKTFMGGNVQALDAIRRSPRIFTINISRHWNQTVQALHQIGIPDSKVSEFIFKSPIILTVNPKRMIEIGLRLEKMGFDMASPAYRAAFTLMSKVSHSNLERKLENYRSMGFTDAEILNIFRRQPTCMFLSEKTIRALVTFYGDRLHMSTSYLSQRPTFLLRSLERRVIPRCSVMQVLWSKGIISKTGKLGSLLAYKEEDFLERYVIKYEAEVPELQAAYRDKLVFKEYTFHLREIQSYFNIRKPVEKVK